MNDIREVAQFSEREPRSVWVFATTREVARVRQSLKTTIARELREVGTLRSRLASWAYRHLKESAQISSAIVGRSSTVCDSVERASIYSTATSRVRITFDVREVGAVQGRSMYDGRAKLRDSARIIERASPNTTASAVLRESLGGLSRATALNKVVLREVAELLDTTSRRLKARWGVHEVAFLVSSADRRERSRSNVRDTGRFAERTSTLISGVIVLRDVLYASDNAEPPPYGRAYTCSIITWGMSTFSNFPFKTMAGQLAAGRNLWRLGGDTDHGQPIKTKIKTSVYDFGSPALKHLTALYVSGESSTPMEVTVTGDVNSRQESYKYRVNARRQDDVRSSRALVGKGFRSRYYQLMFETTDRFKLVDVAVDVNTTNRRL